MSRKNKKLYYEVIPAETDTEESSAVMQPSDAVAERDAYAELIAAVKNTPRVRFRVQPDSNGGKSIATMFLAAVIIAGGLLLSLAKNRAAIIAISVCLLAAIAVGISILIYITVKARRVYYCYYVNTDGGVFCMSVIDDCAVVFANGTAYRIKGDEFYTMDGSAFIKYLDGECCGLLSVLSAARDDVEFVDENDHADGGVYFVKNSVGGGHTVAVENGRIVEITSEQPYNTGEVDGKTGEARIRTKVFVKTDPEEDFELTVPDFVADRLRDNGVDIGELIRNNTTL